MKRYSRKAVLTALVALVLALSMVPVAAITDGEPTEDFEHVVLLIADVDDSPAFRCSGTLIAPTVVVTAGHCVSNYDYPEDPAETIEVSGMRVFPDADVDAVDHYPFAGDHSVEAVSWHEHPAYRDAPFFVNDLGVVVLSEPIVVDEYGELPTADQLDRLKTKRGKQNTMFTAVGYGLQAINPVFVQSERVRHVAYPHLIQINVPGFTGDFSLLLSNNHSTGGTCFGDSGGPNFLGDSNVIAGVTSFGINGNCAGTGGVFRLDRAAEIEFVESFLP
jgi:V8-like Glu-specific endopeptidase